MAPQIQIKVVVEKACHITAKYNDLTNTYWYNWNNTPVDPGIYTLAANYTALVNGSTGITSKTMTITSDEDISVYVVNYYAA